MKIEVNENEAIIDGKRYVLVLPEERINHQTIWLQGNEWHITTWDSDGSCTHEVRLCNGGPEPIICDLWLVPGQPCEVWDDGDEDIALVYFFSKYDETGTPLFTTLKKLVGSYGCNYDHYRPIGTIWDHLPNDIIGIAKDKDGEWWACREKPERGIEDWRGFENCINLEDYHIPFDRCWKESWTPRPEWARREE
jgi:hypothetical protein